MEKNREVVLKEGFFLKYLWGPNFYRLIMRVLQTKEERKKGLNLPSYPDYRFEFWSGILSAPIVWAWTIATLLLLLIAVAVCYLVSTAVLMFGYAWVSDRKKYWRCRSKALRHQHCKHKILLFHPYRRWGNDDEKTMPAPWWFWVPGILAGIMIYSEPVRKEIMVLPERIFWFMLWLMSHPVGWIIFGSLAAIVILVMFFRSKAAKSCQKAVRAIDCPIIIVKKKPR